MFIQTETTPNPQVVKFLPPAGQKIMSAGAPQTAEWRTSKTASQNPLASKLFDLSGIASVFFGIDFIAITKNDEYSWEQMKPEILSTLVDFFSVNDSADNDLSFSQVDSSKAAGFDLTESDQPEIAEKINEIIETKVRPAVAQDGGDIQLVRFEKGVAYLKMRGACAGCPSSTITLKNGVENLLRYYVPELVGVEAEEDLGEV